MACLDCVRARKTIQFWLDQQSHARCWYYPDLFRKLARIYKIVARKPPELPPLKAFQAGCRKYQDEEFS